MELANLKYLVVGAGFFGSVIAERIARDRNERVLLIDKRDHTGGNSYSEIDPETGIECHKYGSHIFHTSDEKVWHYINRFCTFNSYRHRVLTKFDGKVYHMPINLESINSFYAKNLTPAEAAEFLRLEIARDKIHDPQNLEDKAISLIGRPLYEAFVRGYTAKQWETDPRQLPANIITRLPVRYSYKIDYFNDPWQGIPGEGYFSIFERMLKHSNIEVLLGTDFFNIRHLVPNDCLIIYTGPIDRFFDYRHGRLGWRSLRFEKEVYGIGDFQGTAVMNYAESTVPFTRIHEFRHYHEERNYPDDKTIIFREYSKCLGIDEEPYYPINTDRDREMFRKYDEECKKAVNVIFGGRQGSYKYLDMDQSIAAALQTYEREIMHYQHCRR